MGMDLSTIHNHNEGAVLAALQALGPQYPAIADNPGLQADVACVALNRLPSRYIRHTVDYLFYLTDRERADHEKAIDDAVKFAFEFVQSRVAMRARA